MIIESAVHKPTLIHTRRQSARSPARKRTSWPQEMGETGTCENLPAMGGKKTANTAKKISAPHMMTVVVLTEGI